MDKNNPQNLSMNGIEILVNNEKKRYKKWLIIGICACVMGLLTLAGSRRIGEFIQNVSPKTNAEVFDRNGETGVYSFMEIDFLEPFYSDRISHYIGGNYESAEHNYYLIGNSKTNEFAIAIINYDSIIEDFSNNSNGYIVYGNSQSIVLPELEFSNNNSDEEKKIESIINPLQKTIEITGDYSIEAIKKLSDKFDVSENQLYDLGTNYLYVFNKPKTDTSVFSACLYIIFIFLMLCSILAFIPILWATSNIDRCNEKPLKFKKTSVYFNSLAFLWRVSLLADNLASLPKYFEFCGSIKLTKKEPLIALFEDGVKTVEYCLQTEGEENFKGKYFLVSIRIAFTGNPVVPTMQIDGFISDTPEYRKMTLGDIGYRMEGHFLACGGDDGKQRYEMLRGLDLPMKALKYPGYTTPSNIRLIGICPDCKQSFCFHGYAFYMAQSDIAYSDDGLDCCVIPPYNIDKDTWSYETDGKTFRYYNSFNCPHCGTPYIDYRKYPHQKMYGVSGCVFLDKKAYEAKLPREEQAETMTSLDRKANEAKLSREEKAEQMTLAILEKVDLSGASINIFLLERGDMSRYHEIICLQYHESEWSLIEDYLTPEYSFSNETKIENLSFETLSEWIKSFILVNDLVFLNNAACKEGSLVLLPVSKNEL